MHREWQHAHPLLLLVNSERVDGEVRGWQLKRGSYLLQRPAAVSVGFTPSLAKCVLRLRDSTTVLCALHLCVAATPGGLALPCGKLGDATHGVHICKHSCCLTQHATVWHPFYTPCPYPYALFTIFFSYHPCRLTLAQLNPLLHNCVELLEDSRVAAEYAPAGMRWPHTQGRLSISPLKLVLGEGQLVSELLALARLRGGGLQVGGWRSARVVAQGGAGAVGRVGHGVGGAARTWFDPPHCSDVAR